LNKEINESFLKQKQEDNSVLRDKINNVSRHKKDLKLDNKHEANHNNRYSSLISMQDIDQMSSNDSKNIELTKIRIKESNDNQNKKPKSLNQKVMDYVKNPNIKKEKA